MTKWHLSLITVLVAVLANILTALIIDEWTIRDYFIYYLFDFSFAPPFGLLLSILLGMLVAKQARMPEQEDSRSKSLLYILFRNITPALLLGVVSWPVGAYMGLVWFLLSGGGF